MYINCQDLCRHGHDEEHHEEHHSHHHKPNEGIEFCPMAATCHIAQGCPMLKEMLSKSSTQYNIEKFSMGNRDIDMSNSHYDGTNGMGQFQPYPHQYPNYNYHPNYFYHYYPMHPMHPIYPMHPNYPLHPYYPMHPQYPMHDYYQTYPQFQQGRIDDEVEENKYPNE